MAVLSICLSVFPNPLLVASDEDVLEVVVELEEFLSAACFSVCECELWECFLWLVMMDDLCLSIGCGFDAG